MTDAEFDEVLKEAILGIEIEILDEENDQNFIETENEQSIPKELVQQSFNGNQKITTLNYN